ncbi:hypothetical protein Tco_1168777 [Tanacetum coccineum]
MKVQDSPLNPNHHLQLLLPLKKDKFLLLYHYTHNLQKTQTPRQAKRCRDTKIPHSGGPSEKVGDEVVHKELSGSLKCQEAIGGTIAQTRSEKVPTSSYDLPLLGGNTPRSDEERLKQHELMDNVPPTPHDSPLPGGHTPGSDEGRLKQDKLTDIITALSKKVEGLESDLMKTNKLYAIAFKELINRVKSLEGELKFQKSKSKRSRLTLVTSEDEEDLNLETQKGFGDGPEVTTVDAELNTTSTFVSTTSPQRNADTIADDLTRVEKLYGGPERVLLKIRGFTDTEWDDVLARVAGDEDFVQQLQAGEKCSEEDLPMKLVELVNQRKKLDNLVKLWDLVKERFSTTKPTDDKEKELWVKLKRLFEPDNDDIIWKLQNYMHDPLVWRLYDTCGVHHVFSVRGHDIFMLVEKEYPLTRGTLGLMIVARLLVEADSEMSRELLRKIFF